MKKLLIALLLLISIGSFAQKQYALVLKANELQVNILEKEKWKSLDPVSVYVYIILTDDSVAISDQNNTTFKIDSVADNTVEMLKLIISTKYNEKGVLILSAKPFPRMIVEFPKVKYFYKLVTN
ncbi:MAG TPA: hypothetical protein PLS56_01310 [Candidatus Dojkabacteria bacterium]|nr:hypothetical protein [Candidatus Dojkabacteria bacterium]